VLRVSALSLIEFHYSPGEVLPICRAEIIPNHGRIMSKTLELTLPGNALIDLIQAVLVRGSSIKIEAGGTSMFPFIRNGDVVTLSALRDKSPRVGDVVAFRVSGSDRLAFHRVAGKINDRCLIRGDNCEEADGLASKSDILGRVCAVERNGAGVYFGFGLERRLIAFLSRSNLMSGLNRIIGLIIGLCR